MFKTAWTIAKKEFKRFFGDRRMLFSVVILPGLLMYVIYSFMGSFMQNAFTTDEKYVPVIYAVNAPESAKLILGSMDMAVSYFDKDADIEGYKELLADKGLDLLIVYPDNFDEEVAAYDASSGTAAPAIEIFYNSAKTESDDYYKMILNVYDSYEAMMINKFDINSDATVRYDMASEQDSFAAVLGGIVPMLLIMMMVSSCMSITGDAIAGEKERGTIATLLVTPVSRSGIALGKIFSVCAIAILSACVTFAALMASVPKLVGGLIDINLFELFTIGDYVTVLFVVISTELMIASVFAVLSGLAKTIKEAGGYATPIYILSIVVSMYAGYAGAKTNLYMFTIPIYNSAMILTELFKGGYSGADVAVTVASNLVITAICVYILTRLFNSEKVMFSK